MVKKKRGWIRIVEAFVAILLLAGILLMMVGEGYIGKKDNSKEIYNAQVAVLRDVQVEESLREDMLEVEEAQVKTGDDGFPLNVQAKIDSGLPGYLGCEAHICDIDSECSATGLPDKSIYVRSVFISDPAEENNKQLKLFCWEK